MITSELIYVCLTKINVKFHKRLSFLSTKLNKILIKDVVHN
jgi:hypothetical protein